MSTTEILFWALTVYLYFSLATISKYIERTSNSNNKIVELLETLNERIESVEAQVSEINTNIYSKIPPRDYIDCSGV
jgi:DNA-binding transcriptional MerR regulator